MYVCACISIYVYALVLVLMVCENRILFKQLCKMKLHWIGIQLNILLHCKNEKREGFDYSSEASLENLEICDTLSNNSKCWVINSVMYGSLERECRTRCNEIFLKIIPTFLFHTFILHITIRKMHKKLLHTSLFWNIYFKVIF